MSGSVEVIEDNGRVQVRLPPFDMVCYDNERLFLDYPDEQTRPFSVDDLLALKQVVDRMLEELIK